MVISEIAECKIILETENFDFLKATFEANTFSKFIVIADSNTLEHCFPLLITNCPELSEAEIIELEPGEESKEIETVIQIWNRLLEIGIDKNALIINLGGGVISDLGGFIASTYKRGLSFINIPTTLLAMVDAAIGGKNGVDLNYVKNIIGVIKQPNAVYIYPEFLYTLSAEQMKNGMAELIKIGLIGNKPLFNSILSQKGDITKLISKAIQIKSKVVLKDPFDEGYRKILNFGHTIGHAIESIRLSKSNPLLHGEAVAIGMVIESIISNKITKLPKVELDIIEKFISSNYYLPIITDKFVKQLIGFIKMDKKNANSQIKMSLLKSIGKCSYNVVVSESQIESAIAIYNKQYANTRK
ncbi:MAG: 3-dehydroquinate synthase [Bacteroidia bacterium]